MKKLSNIFICHPLQRKWQLGADYAEIPFCFASEENVSYRSYQRGIFCVCEGLLNTSFSYTKFLLVNRSVGCLHFKLFFRVRQRPSKIGLWMCHHNILKHIRDTHARDLGF